MAEGTIASGMGGSAYIPFDERSGGESVVYFTRELSPAGLLKVYDEVSGALAGKVAVKLHTGEPHGPNIIPRPWVKELMQKRLDAGTIVETNTYYEGGRHNTEVHRKTIQENGWTFVPVDIMDADGTAMLPVRGGKWFTEMSVGKSLLDYESLLALTHFKGHAMGGFGGSNKNIGIGCADGQVGKKMIHTTPGSSDMWDIAEEELMERMTESAKAAIDHFGRNVAFVNVMRNMSVSCDCEGTAAQPVVTPDVGILSSLDMLAIDQACVDIVYAMPPDVRHDMVERIESRRGLRQLTYMAELGVGNARYKIVDLDNGGREVTAADIAAQVGDTWVDDGQGHYAD
ncbi:DUF362 domain-containing protein [Xiamenia xianingshaonis]|uniref:DUF362 domain-containing protein n=1 Tax=Xiamenia xianingshaonis TaxID=2682776 RepID=UPI0028F740BB|nr:DUF362 domain-containing protein [Xiamenia xianingshaonis]